MIDFTCDVDVSWQSELTSSLSDVIENFEEADEGRKKRDEAFRYEISDEDRSSLKDGRRRIVKTALETLVSTLRRKRSTRIRRSSQYCKTYTAMCISISL